MKKTPEELKTLKAEILDGLRIVKQNQEKLDTLEPKKISSETSEQELILIGYYLTSIYSSFEEVFKNIARDFENKIDDPSRWHVVLLHRMSLDIEAVRPSVISKLSEDCLHELLRFRHVFRFSYAFELDWEKMRLVVKRWQRCKDHVVRDIRRFVKFLDKAAEG